MLSMFRGEVASLLEVLEFSYNTVIDRQIHTHLFNGRLNGADRQIPCHSMHSTLHVLHVRHMSRKTKSTILLLFLMLS